MSKFLAQSKSFLPMVIQKSATEMVKPTLDSNATVVAKQPNLKVESKSNILSVTLADQHNMQDLLLDTMPAQASSCQQPGTVQQIPTSQQIPTAQQIPTSQRIPTAQQIPTSQQILTAQEIQTVQKILTPLLENMKTPAVQQVNAENNVQRNNMISSTQRTLVAAFKLDLGLMQEQLAEWAARGHMWLYRHQSGLLRTLQVRESSEQGSREGLVWLEGKTRLKEEEPVPVFLPENLKKKPVHAVKSDKVKDDSGKKEGKSKEPFKSNFLETVQDKAPKWQVAISDRLGALQKAVVQKLSEGKK